MSTNWPSISCAKSRAIAAGRTAFEQLAVGTVAQLFEEFQIDIAVDEVNGAVAEEEIDSVGVVTIRIRPRKDPDSIVAAAGFSFSLAVFSRRGWFFGQAFSAAAGVAQVSAGFSVASAVSVAAAFPQFAQLRPASARVFHRAVKHIVRAVVQHCLSERGAAIAERRAGARHPSQILLAAAFFAHENRIGLPRRLCLCLDVAVKK